MDSGARNMRALVHLGNGTLPPSGGSAEIGVPGRRPSGAPRGAKVEPAVGGNGMRRPCASPGPRFARGQFAPPLGAPPQGCGRPRTCALTATWGRWVAMSVPAATNTAGAAHAAVNGSFRFGALRRNQPHRA